MSVTHSNKLGRSFFIKNKTEIDQLFRQGDRIKSEIIKTVWLEDKDANKKGISLFVSVPKRLIAKASNRNLIKRRIKEALRLNLGEIKKFAKDNDCNLQIGVVYASDDIADFKMIEAKIILSLQNIYTNITEEWENYSK